MADAPTVGIIGLGIGRAHIRGFQANGCKVVAVCQRDEQAARAVAERYGIPGAFSRWQDLIAQAKPQIVAVASPPNLHRDMVVTAIKSGAHVLCEKPLAMNQAEALEMIAAAKAHDKIAMTAFNWRWSIAMQELARRIAAGEIGRVLAVNGRWFGAAWADEATKSTWRMDAQQAGHGAMGDMGVHMVDMIRSQIGEFRRVQAAKSVAYPQRTAPGVNRPADADDVCSVIGELDGGAQVTLSICRVAHGYNEHTLEVFGERGALAYKLERPSARWYEGELKAAATGTSLARVELPALDATHADGDPMEQVGGTLFKTLIARMLEGIRTGKTPAPSLEDGLKAQRVLDAIATSAADRGHWVEVAR
ncbi:MAG: Gfo/Idh/MocA family oxidoreductase [Alphaproteobacteria bacterium]|nr:Gfo/Idh/MocA family oxidoreductase [Alphaproteobacteria bacterium]